MTAPVERRHREMAVALCQTTSARRNLDRGEFTLGLMARAIADAEAAGYARGLAAGAERWIPCSERMPEPETIVLTCKQGDDEPMMLEVTPDGLTWLSDRGEHLATVGEDDDLVPDFWMPLPDPPAIPVETERKGEV